ncbi:MAG: hypothetical protein IT373_19505 [Polyangiaceae bacterium]|nr:hypothetical protein [Polyangiaceae bacterium]
MRNRTRIGGCPAACALLLLALGGCPASRFTGGTVHGDGYAFTIPEPPGAWRQIAHNQAALAFRDEPNRGLVLFNAHCHVDSEDVPLQALTNHLFLTFTEREITVQEVVPFDGREAMHTALGAKLDGVPQRYDVWVLKKDECVYDLIYAAPEPGFERGVPVFREVVRGFATVPSGG